MSTYVTHGARPQTLPERVLVFVYVGFKRLRSSAPLAWVLRLIFGGTQGSASQQNPKAECF